MNKIYLTSSLALLLSVISLGYLMFLLYWPVRTSEIYNSPVPIDKAEYSPAEEVVATIRYCKFTDLPAVVNRQLHNSTIIYYSPFVSGGPKGCGTADVKIKLPDVIPTGDYTLETFLEYRVNPLRIARVNYKTQKFKIIQPISPEVLGVMKEK